MPFRANLLRVLLLGLFLSLGACASRQDTLPTTVETSQSAVDAEPDFDDYDDDDAGTADPFESWNRVWFGFNDTLMRHVLDPAYRGYSHIVPEKVRGGISHFRENLKAPVRFVNHLLQGEFAQAGVEIGRFIINSCTSLGFADVA